MIAAVFDCGILVSALGWSGNPRYCLDLVYAGQVDLCVSVAVWEEYTQRIPVILAEEQPTVDAGKELARLLKLVHFVQPVPLGKPRSRDWKDDPYLACALAARAEAIVSNDRDSLTLRKPFGIPVLTPVQFLRLARGAQ
jgi:putative PIN family toxin of toxin-antitoxin system